MEREIKNEAASVRAKLMNMDGNMGSNLYP